jgi:hypothetical protein
MALDNSTDLGNGITLSDILNGLKQGEDIVRGGIDLIHGKTGAGTGAGAPTSTKLVQPLNPPPAPSNTDSTGIILFAVIVGIALLAG